MSKWAKRIYASLIFLFLYAPIIVLIVFSFNAGKYSGNWEGFSFRWYQELVDNSSIMKALYYTLTVAFASSIIATIIGTFAAFGIHHMRPVKKTIMLNVNNIPVLNPDIVTGVALMTLFGFVKMKFGVSTMLIAHITFNIPYVILSVLPKLKQLPQDALEAAMDLGATPWYAFRKVIFPEILPGIVTGCLIAFTLSVDDFVISFFTTGNGVTNLSIAIFSMARRGIKPVINALSTIMFGTVLGLLLIVNRRTGDLSELDV